MGRFPSENPLEKSTLRKGHEEALEKEEHSLGNAISGPGL